MAQRAVSDAGTRWLGYLVPVGIALGAGIMSSIMTSVIAEQRADVRLTSLERRLDINLEERRLVTSALTSNINRLETRIDDLVKQIATCSAERNQ